MDEQPTFTPPPVTPTDPYQAPISPFTPMVPVEQPKRSRKKLFIILAIVLLVIGLAVAGWFVFGNKNKQAAPANTQSSTTPPTPLPDSVVYAFRSTDKDPYSIYWRPATGGDRQQALSLTSKYNNVYYQPNYSDIHGQKVIFDSNDGIYLSVDSGKTFNNIYKIDPAKAAQNQAITSLHFSTDGQKIVFALLPAATSGQTVKNTVKSIDLNGNNATDLQAFDSKGVFIYSYDDQKKTLVYATGCYFCDGGPGVPHNVDLTTKKDSSIVTVGDTEIYNPAPIVSVDGKKLIYFVGTNNKDAAKESVGPGWPGAPPYKIRQVNIDGTQALELASVGNLNEKSSDGKYRIYNVLVGYSDDFAPFYVADNKLFVQRSGNFGKVFEADNNIWQVPYLSDKTLVVRTGDSKGNDLVANFDIATQKSTSIYQGDQNTKLFGVTTK